LLRREFETVKLIIPQRSSIARKDEVILLNNSCTLTVNWRTLRGSSCFADFFRCYLLFYRLISTLDIEMLEDPS